MDLTQKSPKLLAQPLTVVLLIIAAIFAVTAVVLPVQQLLQGNSASATLDVSRDASLEALNRIQGVPAGSVVTPTNSDGLTVVVTAEGTDQQEVPLGLRVLTDLGTSVWALAVAAIAVLLALVVGSISSGHPFHLKNAKRITWIAIAILVGSLGADSLNFLQAHLLYDYLDLQPPLQVVPYYSWTPVLLAALMFVLAFAFRRGQEIQDDVEGLV